MKRKYNIALRPQTQQAAIVRVANGLSSIAGEYQLGEHSLPHVTLYQFYAEEEVVAEIWGNMMRVLDIGPIKLTFEQFSFITFDNSIFWISLLPNCCSLLNGLHQYIARMLNEPINSKFDPHMTLINSCNKEYQNIGEKLIRGYQSITDEFQVGLGLSDEIGQYKKDIFTKAQYSRENENGNSKVCKESVL